MVNQTRRENLSASLSSGPIPVAPGNWTTAPDRTEGADQSNLPKETSHDPQGTAGETPLARVQVSIALATAVMYLRIGRQSPVHGRDSRSAPFADIDQRISELAIDRSTAAALSLAA
jgi:hypothetical protein